MKALVAADAEDLRQLPNIGPAMIEDFKVLDIAQPAQLAGKDPYTLYQRLCEITGIRHDPCVLDTFISAVRFMDGESPRPWWHYTAERKRLYPGI